LKKVRQWKKAKLDEKDEIEENAIQKKSLSLPLDER
jgi:hypothetical protein